jgi:hypothetical protein
MLLILWRHHHFTGSRFCRATLVGPAGALRDPPAQQRNFVRRQRLRLLGPALGLVIAQQQLDEQTFIRRMSHDRLVTGLAGRKSIVFVVEPQPTFLLFRSVAGITMLLEQWTHFAGEIDEFPCLKQRRCHSKQAEHHRDAKMRQTNLEEQA